MWRRIKLWLIAHPMSWLVDYICADVPNGHRDDLAALVGIPLDDIGGAKWQREGDDVLLLWYQGPAPLLGYTKRDLTEGERDDLAALGEWDAEDVAGAEWARLQDAAPNEGGDA